MPLPEVLKIASTSRSGDLAGSGPTGQGIVELLADSEESIWKTPQLVASLEALAVSPQLRGSRSVKLRDANLNVDRYT